MADLLPRQACALVVPAAETAAPTCFLGLAVHGDEAALTGFEAGMHARGVRGGRVPGENPAEIMTFFAGSSRASAFSLLRDAINGRFGRLKVEVIVAPAAKSQDGLDLDTEVTAESPNFLNLPAE